MKRLLLIDAVEFPPEKAAHPLSDVGNWFGRYCTTLPDVDFHSIPASHPDLETQAAKADGVILSGSPRDAWSDEPAILRLVGLLRVAVNSGQPVFGVCFGHQLLARAFGGKVERNPAGWEIGLSDVTLTTAGHQCGLFAGLPSPLRVIESHQDAVLTLPPDATLLGSTAHSSIQAFALGDRTFGVQFHPEMNGDILRHLWSGRRDRVRPLVPFDLDAALDSVGETPDAARLFANFTALITP